MNLKLCPIEKKIRNRVGENRSENFSSRTVHDEGSKALIETGVLPVIDASGKFTGFKNEQDKIEIRKVQDALVKSEAQYRQLVELAQEGIWVFDKNYNVVFANPRMAQMLGYAESEIINKSLYDFMDKRSENSENLLSYFRKDAKGQCEYTFLRQDGTYLHTSIVTSNIIDDQGRYVGTLALVADITRRKQTEEALKKSEELSKAIVLIAPLGIATSDQSKHFLSANNAFCEILGYSENELRKLTFREISFQNDIAESEAKMKDLVANKISSFTQEKRYRKKDGSVIEGRIIVNALRDENGKPVIFIAELENITERKNKERELQQERKKLEAITHSIGAGYVVIDKDFKVAWANKFIKDYKGDVEGKLCYTTLNDLTHVCPNCGVKKVFEDGVNFDSHEYCSIDINGNPYCVELIATPMIDESGKVMSAVEVAVDITEKKNMQTQLAEYSQKLEILVEEKTAELKETQLRLVKSERLAAIGELAGMVGHDLRNPLTGIKNAVYYLKKKGSECQLDKTREMFEVIEKCIDHSNKIINDLLDYSREIQLELKESSPGKLISEALAMIQVPEKVKIQSNVSDAYHIIVDEEKIERVFINIIKNAIDAMPKGGSLTINSQQINDDLQFSFTDTGSGIPAEILPKIFSPLFTTKAQGMGFGLAICKRKVEAHGGKITVATALGKGTTFTVILPINKCRVC